jgi:hypothetical protein
VVKLTLNTRERAGHKSLQVEFTWCILLIHHIT